jgi:hypothetical protein
MNKIIAILLSLGFSLSAFSSGLKCDLQQSLDGKDFVTKLEVQKSDDPHGGLQFFTADQFEGVTGFVSLLQNNGNYYAIINIYSEKLDVGSSSHAQMTSENQYVHHQLIMPSTGRFINAVIVDCYYTN